MDGIEVERPAAPELALRGLLLAELDGQHHPLGLETPGRRRGKRLIGGRRLISAAQRALQLRRSEPPERQCDDGRHRSIRHIGQPLVGEEHTL